MIRFGNARPLLQVAISVLLMLCSTTVHAAADKAAARAFAAIIARAERGSAKEQFALGQAYFAGRDVSQDDAAAISWFRKAAEQGHAAGQFGLGTMYYIGRGVPQDRVAGLSWWRKAAEQGHASAQAGLGAHYAGPGVAQDITTALSWYRKAADQGHAVAQGALGYAYHAGKGVPQDYAAAANWYRKAADQGLTGAQYNLGLLYVDGQGVPQDYVEAHKWFNLSSASATDATQRDKSFKDRDFIAAKMQPAQIAEAQRMASAWRKVEKAAIPVGSKFAAARANCEQFGFNSGTDNFAQCVRDEYQNQVSRSKNSTEKLFCMSAMLSRPQRYQGEGLQRSSLCEQDPYAHLKREPEVTVIIKDQRR